MGGRWWDEVYMDCLATEFASPVLGRVFVPDLPPPESPPPEAARAKVLQHAPSANRDLEHRAMTRRRAFSEMITCEAMQPTDACLA